jgi:hypothetical protein
MIEKSVESFSGGLDYAYSRPAYSATSVFLLSDIVEQGDFMCEPFKHPYLRLKGAKNV